MSTNKRRGVRRVVPNIAKARVVKQTQFDDELIAVESLVSEFSDILHQPSGDRERLWAIRLRELPEAVRSLEWAMKKAQMKALPLEGGK